MKKSWLQLFIPLILSLSFVSALPTFDPSSATQGAIDIVQSFFAPVFQSFLGGGFTDYLFEAVLFFFIILCFVYVVLSKVEVFGKNKAVTWTITIAVSILAVRFTSNASWVEFVLLPYNVLGVSLLAIIPFIIYFFFIGSFDSSVIRKFGWAIYSITYIGMWYTQFDSIGDIAFIYLFAAILGFILIVSDGTIRGIMARNMVKRGLNDAVAKRIADIQKKIEKNQERLNSGISPTVAKIIQREIDEDVKELKRVSKTLRI